MIEVVKEFSYLGVCLSHNLKASTYFQVNQDKAKSALARVMRFTSAKKQFPVKLASNLCQALVRSVFSYGSEIYAWGNHEVGNKMMRSCYKKCLGLPQSAPSSATELILGKRSYEVFACMRGFKLWRKLVSSRPQSLLHDA